MRKPYPVLLLMLLLGVLIAPAYAYNSVYGGKINNFSNEPTTGTAFAATANMKAKQTDAGGSVTKIKSFYGVTKLEENLTFPYYNSWTEVVANTFSPKVKSTDNPGLTTALAAKSITVATPTMQSGTSSPRGLGVWIDFNNDKDFADAGEFVYASPSYSINNFYASITIPATATLGATRMREKCKSNSTVTSAESCLSMAYGEAEDYTITISTNVAPTVNIYKPGISSAYYAPATLNIIAEAA